MRLPVDYIDQPLTDEQKAVTFAKLLCQRNHKLPFDEVLGRLLQCNPAQMAFLLSLGMVACNQGHVFPHDEVLIQRVMRTG